MKGELGKVYLRDDEPYDIIEKEDMVVSLSNSLTLKLRNVKHVPKLKKNLISIRQLTGRGMKATFNGDVSKITKDAMVMAHGKKEVPST